MELIELKAEMDQQFAQTRQQLERITVDAEQTRRHFEQRLTAEGEQTRRHFDVVAEQMKAERNLSLDSSKGMDERLMKVSASNAADHVAFERRLEDHEQRLSKLESQ